MKTPFYSAIATLIGTTIGAGILAVPYVVNQAGLILGLTEILIIGLAIIVLNLYMGEITLRFREKHQLSGYAEKILGKTGKELMVIAMIVTIYGALTAYIMGVGISLGAVFGANPAFFSIIFFIIGAFVIHNGLKMVEKTELVLMIGMLITVGVIIFSAFFSGKVNPANFTQNNFGNILLPFGVILFAFLGEAAIPEMRLELEKNKKLFKKAIIASGVISILIYTLFAIAVVGVTGEQTTEVATVGLGQAFGQGMLVFANLFAAIAMSTSFIALGLALKQVYEFDFGMSRTLAWALTVSLPIGLFLMGALSFITIIGVVGGIAGGIQGILIINMHRKAKKKGDRKPEFSIFDKPAISLLIGTMFIVGITYSLFLAL